MPMPVTRPAQGASSLYMPLAARGLNSRKGVSGSSTASMRSRTNILPRSLWRLTAASPPPFLTVSSLDRSSATSCFIAAPLSLFAYMFADIRHNVFGRCARLKNLSDAHFLQLRDVLIRNDTADQNQHIVEPFFLHQFHDSRAQRHVGSGQHGESDNVGVFL